MQTLDAIFLSLGLFALLVIATGFSFLCGLGLRRALKTTEELRAEWQQRKKVESIPESAVVDSSPAHLKQKIEERRRRGEPEEDADSQIVNTKTPQQHLAEVKSARERRLDKWMPGVRRGRS